MPLQEELHSLKSMEVFSLIQKGSRDVTNLTINQGWGKALACGPAT